MPPPIDRTVARFLQAKVPEWFNIDTEVKPGRRARDGMIGLREAADKLDVDYPSLRNVIKKATGAGEKFERRIAELRFKGDRGKLDKAAQKWAEQNPEHAPPSKSEPQMVRDALDERIAARGRERGLPGNVIEAATQARARDGIKALTTLEVDELLDLALGFGRATDRLFRGNVIRDAGGSPVDDFKQDQQKKK